MKMKTRISKNSKRLSNFITVLKFIDALNMPKIIIPFLVYSKLMYLPLVVSFYTQYFFLSAYSRTS